MSTEFIQEVLRLTNQLRAENGLNSLTLNSELGRAAQNHTNDMATNDFGGHTGSNGSTVDMRIRDAGYEPVSFWGENVATGQITPQEAFDWWSNSPGHRANMLNPNFTEVGIGYINSSNTTDLDGYADYWTQVFSNGDTNSDSTPTSEVDAILGTDAAETLTGTEGNDFIIGKGDADTLTGGAGADMFIFLSGSEGLDTITDFNSSEGDKLVFVGQEFFDSSLGATNASIDWSNNIVSYGNAQIAYLAGANSYSYSTGTDFASAGLPNIAV